MFEIIQVIGIVTLVFGVIILLRGLTENVEVYEKYNYNVNNINNFNLNENIDSQRKTEFGGVVMIGPIPIVFGNNSRAVNLAIVLTILLMVLFFLMLFLPYGIRV